MPSNWTSTHSWLLLKLSSSTTRYQGVVSEEIEDLCLCIAHPPCSFMLTDRDPRDNLQIPKFPGRQPRVWGWWHTQSCLHIIHTYLLLSELNFRNGTAAYQHPTFGSLNNEIESLFKCGECHKCMESRFR